MESRGEEEKLKELRVRESTQGDEINLIKISSRALAKKRREENRVESLKCEDEELIVSQFCSNKGFGQNIQRDVRKRIVVM